MKPIRIALLTTLLLLPAARVWAQAYDAAGARELYHAEVCNEGRITADVAVAYKDFGFTDEFWMITYWYRVEPGKCKLVFQHFYAPQSMFNFQSFPLYLAFAFTDSTGVWGAAKVNPARDTAASRLHLCVGRKNYEYRVNGKNPQAKCPKGLLIPAAIVWEPTRGVYAREFGGYPPPKRFTVVLGPNDRAIALGPQASPSGAAQGPDTSAVRAGDDHTALKVAAGIGTIVVLGAIINEIIDQSKCNSPIPKPFERGTLNAEVLRKPVVRRTCQQADWFVRDRQGDSYTLKSFIDSNDRSVGSVLDPPQQVDAAAGKADVAADPEVKRIVAALDGLLGSRGGTNMTNYGKFRYKPAGEATDEVWVNLVSLDLFRATFGVQSGVSTMSIPCTNDQDCVMVLRRRQGHINVLSRVQLYLQGQGTWQQVAPELSRLKVMFPKQPVVQAN